MAYDFPNSPTPGQVFQKWTWNGSAWVLTTPVNSAANITFAPVGDLVATDVQAAIVEVDAEMHAADTALQTNINAKVNRAGDTMTGLLVTAPSGPIGAAGSTTSLQVVATGTGEAVMSFHRPGAYAVNFGLATDNNFWYGGWSLGGTNYRFWTTKDFGNISAYLSNGRTAFAGDAAIGTGGSYVDSVANAVLSGYQASLDYSGTQYLAKGFRTRAVQGYTTGWFTYAFA